MSFIDDFSTAFLPAYQRSLQSWQEQENADRRFALEQERHKADMEERGLRMDAARSQAARDKQYIEGVQGLVADRRQGVVDPTATAQKAAGLIAAQGDDYDGGRIAREMAGKVRDPGKKLKGSEFTRGMADLELQTGRADATRYAQSQELAKGQQWDEDAVTHVQAWRAMTPEQRSQLLAEASKGDEIKGFFSWEPGVKGKSTYWYMKESGGRPLQLSESDAERLYTLTQLAAVDPDRAAKEIGALKGNAKQAAISMLKVQTEAVGTNNRGVDAAADNATRNRELNLRARGSPVQLFNPKTGQTGLFYDGEFGRDKSGMVVLPQGWEFPKTPTEFKFVKDENGGFYTDRQGVAVARHDQARGMVPYEPNPIEADQAVKQRAFKYGIQVVPWVLDGKVIWASRTPDGRAFTSVDEAIDAVIAREAASTTTGPRNEAAKRALGMPGSVQARTNSGVFRPEVVQAAGAARDAISSGVAAVGRGLNPNFANRPTIANPRGLPQ